MPQPRATTRLREVLRAEPFVYMPCAYDPIGARMVEEAGFSAAYTGGFVTGGSRAITEPLLTMTEQVQVAGDVANATRLPVVADAGAGFGEPLHTMRTVREFIRAGVAGIHIEDQLYPKRAHYHKYVAHVIPRDEFIDKIAFACKERDRVDPDFVIIARSDATRSDGFEEAMERINLAADAGADMGLVFPRNPDEMKRAPGLAKIPLVYVQSRGNRDGRPLESAAAMAAMGYKACIDALVMLLVHYHFGRQMLQELKATGDYTAMSNAELVDSRHAIEKLIGLEEFYEIEAQTVEAH